jgi:hypothetical protein
LGNKGIFRGISKVISKRVILVKRLFLGNFIVSKGKFRGFSPKTVPGIVILNPGLLKYFFQFGWATLRGTQKILWTVMIPGSVS